MVQSWRRIGMWAMAAAVAALLFGFWREYRCRYAAVPLALALRVARAYLVPHGDVYTGGTGLGWTQIGGYLHRDWIVGWQVGPPAEMEHGLPPRDWLFINGQTGLVEGFVQEPMNPPLVVPARAPTSGVNIGTYGFG